MVEIDKRRYILFWPPQATESTGAHTHTFTHMHHSITPHTCICARAHAHIHTNVFVLCKCMPEYEVVKRYVTYFPMFQKCMGICLFLHGQMHMCREVCRVTCVCMTMPACEDLEQSCVLCADSQVCSRSFCLLV